MAGPAHAQDLEARASQGQLDLTDVQIQDAVESDSEMEEDIQEGSVVSEAKSAKDGGCKVPGFIANPEQFFSRFGAIVSLLGTVRISITSLLASVTSGDWGGLIANVIALALIQGPPTGVLIYYFFKEPVKGCFGLVTKMISERKALRRLGAKKRPFDMNGTVNRGFHDGEVGYRSNKNDRELTKRRGSPILGTDIHGNTLVVYGDVIHDNLGFASEEDEVSTYTTTHGPRDGNDDGIREGSNPRTNHKDRTGSSSEIILSPSKYPLHVDLVEIKDEINSNTNLNTLQSRSNHSHKAAYTPTYNTNPGANDEGVAKESKTRDNENYGRSTKTSKHQRHATVRVEGVDVSLKPKIGHSAHGIHHSRVRAHRRQKELKVQQSDVSIDLISNGLTPHRSEKGNSHPARNASGSVRNNFSNGGYIAEAADQDIIERNQTSKFQNGNGTTTYLPTNMVSETETLNGNLKDASKPRDKTGSILPGMKLTNVRPYSYLKNISAKRLKISPLRKVTVVLRHICCA